MNIQVGDLWCFSRPNRKPAYFIVKGIEKYLTVEDLRVFTHWLDEDDRKDYHSVQSFSIMQENSRAYRRVS